MATKEVYGYARVSTRDQNLARQLDAFAAFGVPCGNVFADKASGKNFERPAWLRLVSTLEKDDVVVVKSIDRLGRNYEEILEEWRLVTKECGAAIVVLDMPLLDTRERSGSVTNALISDIVLQLLSYVAQVERDNIRQRQAEGIASAKARGVRFGRPRKAKPKAFPAVSKAYQEGLVTRGQAAKKLGVCASTFDKWMRESIGDD